MRGKKQQQRKNRQIHPVLRHACIFSFIVRAMCSYRSCTSSLCLGFFTISICIPFFAGCEFILNENFHRINKSTHRKINTHWILLYTSNEHIHKHQHARPRMGENEFCNKEEGKRKVFVWSCSPNRFVPGVDNTLCLNAKIYLAACEMMLTGTISL